MKKVLLATTVLAGFAGAAFAEDAKTGVSVSGSGRVGIVNYSKVSGTNQASSLVKARLTFNLDAKTVTDSGAELGGRIRLRNDSGDGITAGNDAQLYASYQGLRVEVGNTNTAYDNADLIWRSEMGFDESSYGDPFENTFYYDSKAGGSKSAFSNDYMGIYAEYTVGDFTGRISHVNPDQTVKNLNTAYGTVGAISSETALSAKYKFGQFEVEAGAVQNGAGIKGNNPWFIGAAYAVNENTNVGLNYLDEHMSNAALANSAAVTVAQGGAIPLTVYNPGKTVTLYGNYKMDKITLRGYVAHNDGSTYTLATGVSTKNATGTAVGIGADYDLGGATLAGSVQRGYSKTTRVDIGVRFKF